MTWEEIATRKDLAIEAARKEYEEAVMRYHRKVHAAVMAFDAESKRLKDESETL